MAILRNSFKKYHNEKTPFKIIKKTSKHISYYHTRFINTYNKNKKYNTVDTINNLYIST